MRIIREQGEIQSFCVVPEEGEGHTGYCVREDGEGYYVRPVSHEERSSMAHHYCCRTCGGVYPHATQRDRNCLLFTDEGQRREYEAEEEKSLGDYRRENPFYESTVMMMVDEFRKQFGIPEEVKLFTVIPVKKV